MKYQVGYKVTLIGEMSIEAETPEEATETAIEELNSIDVNGAMSEVESGHTYEPYEWDEAAQERQRKQNEELFNKCPQCGGMWELNECSCKAAR